MDAVGGGVALTGAAAAGVVDGVLLAPLSPQAASRATAKTAQIRGSLVFMVLEAWFAKVQDQSRGGKQGGMCQAATAVLADSIARRN